MVAYTAQPQKASNDVEHGASCQQVPDAGLSCYAGASPHPPLHAELPHTPEEHKHWPQSPSFSTKHPLRDSKCRGGESPRPDRE